MKFGSVLGKLFLGRAHELEGQLAAQRAGLLDFPATVQLADSAVILRLLEASDRDGILRFARSLPQHDLLFLRRDITQPDHVDAWLRDIAEGLYSSIVAVEGDDIVGYATVATDGMDWTAHVAELRVLVAEAMRGKRLGSLLTEQAFAIANERGVRKMIAQMTTDQVAAMRTFSRMGFEPEAVLRNQVQDRDGALHDLQIMSLDVDEFRSRVQLARLNAENDLRLFS